jgi:hypothetical protein
MSSQNNCGLIIIYGRRGIGQLFLSTDLLTSVNELIKSGYTVSRSLVSTDDEDLVTREVIPPFYSTRRRWLRLGID